MNDQPMEVTRRSLHAVAELVLAGPQYQQSHTIQLTVSSGGFRTLAAPHLAVAGTDLIYGEHRLGIAGRTCAELAAAVGVPVRTLGDVYSDGSGVGPHETLRLDPELAYWIEDCWAAGDSAMRRLAPAEQPVLWPEHFDVGVLVDGMGYGVSPGDKCLSEPYAYATPPSPRAGSFWNAPFGAARPMRDLGRFRSGRGSRLLHRRPPARRGGSARLTGTALRNTAHAEPLSGGSRQPRHRDGGSRVTWAPGQQPVDRERRPLRSSTCSVPAAQDGPVDLATFLAPARMGLGPGGYDGWRPEAHQAVPVQAHGPS